MKKRVRPSIALSNGAEILLMKYIYNGTEVLALPGGNIDDNETLQHTLERELEEELGIEIQVEDIILVAETHKPAVEATFHLIFNGSIKNGIPTINPKETSAKEFVWVKFEDLDTKNLYPNVGSFLKQHFLNIDKKGKCYAGDVLQQWF